jgi:Flp pilus assembly protein TadD
MRYINVICLTLILGLNACGPAPTSSTSLTGQARVRVGDAAETSGDSALAASMYAQASSEAPHDAAIQLRYANALMNAGQITQARDVLLKHIPLVSQPLELRRGLGSLYVLEGQPSSALVELDAVLAAKPGDLRAVVDKAIALDLLHRYQEAQPYYLKALTESPDDPVIKNDYAMSLMLQGRVREAGALLTPYRGAGNIPQRITTNLGVILAANGDVAGAKAVVGGSMTDEQLGQLAKAVTENSQNIPSRQ